jgi:hypothetical protein
MPQPITIRLDDAMYGRLIEAFRHAAMDVSAYVPQALITALDRASDTPASAQPHHPDDWLAVVVTHTPPQAQRHLTAVLARPDGILIRQGRSRLLFGAETLALWAAQAEPHAHAADE